MQVTLSFLIIYLVAFATMTISAILITSGSDNLVAILAQILNACRFEDASVTELTHLLHASSHSTFKQLLQQLLLPCLHVILAHKQDPKNAEAAAEEAAPHQLGDTAESLHDMRQRGSAWVMLGMLRLHLAAPPAGADPVGKYAYKKAHFDRILSEDLLPETQVSSMARRLRCRQCVALS